MMMPPRPRHRRSPPIFPPSTAMAPPSAAAAAVVSVSWTWRWGSAPRRPSSRRWRQASPSWTTWSTTSTTTTTTQSLSRLLTLTQLAVWCWQRRHPSPPGQLPAIRTYCSQGCGTCCGCWPSRPCHSAPILLHHRRHRQEPVQIMPQPQALLTGVERKTIISITRKHRQQGYEK